MMRQTLLSRWEGALVGSALAKINKVSGSAKVESWSKMQAQGVRALAETGQWQPIFREQEYTVSETILLCLPLMLFFSDQPEVLRAQLSALAQQQGHSSLETSVLLAYSTILAWAISEQLPKKALFHQLQISLNRESSYKVLETLQDSFHKEITLQETRAKLPLPCQDIGLALYCFATTSEDLTLSVRRVKTSQGSQPINLALVGALSGVHNGVSAIPISWRFLLQKERRQWKQRLKLMWATWSGSYHFARFEQHQELNATNIAPSGVIQPRRQTR